MLERNYKCNRCQIRFETQNDIYPETETKCPVCGSSDVETTGTASNIYELLDKLVGSGGG